MDVRQSQWRRLSVPGLEDRCQSESEEWTTSGSVWEAKH